MNCIKDIINHRHGRFRAFFDGRDLGELASPPEIRAGYEAANFAVQGDSVFARTIEAAPELSAVIKIRVKAVQQALELLEQQPGAQGKLLLKNPDCRPVMQLLFPDCRLQPAWEFAPAFTGEHHILLQFSAKCDSAGKLFYLPGE